MSRPSRGLYTIAPGRAFLCDLAEGIVGRFHRADDPLSLAAVTIFLPTRRAERTLKEEIVKAVRVEALVMPAIRVLGDVDEDEGLIDPQAAFGDLPPAVSRLERDLILAQMLDEKRRTMGGTGGFGVSLSLARALSRLVDDASNEDGDFSKLDKLAPEDLAQHWEATVDLLKLGTDVWPGLLDARGLMNPAERRSRLIRAYAERLQASRPAAPFIVAGSSGSVKATADLMQAIAGLPNGCIVLDGLDTLIDDDTWEALIPSHPQFALKELLVHLAATRTDVGPWRDSGEAADLDARRLFLGEAMRPPKTANRWSEQDRLADARVADGTAGLTLIEAANEREEALAVAVAIREALETEGRTVALVTNDRMLARRTAGELRRWDIDIDDSAGTPLAKTEAGALAGLALEAAAAGGTPVALLSLLKHPRAVLGRDRARVLDLARQIERRLRRDRVTGGFDAVTASLIAYDHPQAGEMRALVQAAQDVLRPLCDAHDGQLGLSGIVAGHVAALEGLTRDGNGRVGAWRGDDGRAAFELLQEFASMQPIALRCADYTIAFDTLARGTPVRPQRPRHPRVQILGVLEARMQAADLMILGGLNEGVWPADPADDPWLSRPMRTALRLSAPERRIGLAAHDFATLAAQPGVLLTRAKRREGSPSNSSRFLLRLSALAEGLGRPIAAHGALAVARRLDEAARVVPAPKPMPRPPFTARPRKLSVTRIETWVRDPYAIYAEQILDLRKLEKLAQARDARDRGTMIHKAAELFAQRAGGPDDPYQVLLACGQEAFGAALDDPDVRAFWWPRFERAARWLAEREMDWREDWAGTLVEEKKEHRYADIDFTLTGTPDRIDRRASGGLRLIDYKTGAVPTKKQVAAAMAPQLPLLAALARAGAFGPDFTDEPAELLYAQIGGGKVAGKLTALDNPVALSDDLEARFKRRVVQFDDPATPYPPRMAPYRMDIEGDYDHLARLDEWGETGEPEP